MKMLRFLLALLVLSPGFLVKGQTFEIKPGGTVVICEGDTVTLTATSGFVRYLWSTGEYTQSIRAWKSGRYYCAAIDRSSKAYADSVDLKVLAAIRPVIVTNPSNKTICKGDSLVMEITNKFNKIEWENGNKTSHNVIRPTSGGYTWVYVVDTNGCKRKEIIQYAVKDCSTSSGCDVITFWPDAVLCGDHDSVLVEAKSGYVRYLWNDGDTNRIRTFYRSGTYILKVQDKTGQYCYDTLEISAGKGPTVEIKSYPSPAVICKGDSIKLYVQGDYKHVKWSHGGENWYTYVKPEKTASYSVKVTGKNGCTTVEDIRVEVKECDTCEVIQWGQKRSLCGDHDSVILEAQSTYVSYHWSTGATTKNITVHKGGWYTITAKNKDGKTCTDSVFIHEGGRGKLELYTMPNPAIVCPGETVVLKAKEGFLAYSWSSGSTNRIIEYKAQESKEIVAYAKDSAGCWVRATVKITVKDTCKKTCGELINLGQKKVLCSENDSIVLELPTGYQSYKWSDGKEGRIRWVKREGWYKVTVKDKDGKECVDSVKILRGGKLKLAVELDPSKFCIGDTITAMATKGFKSYAWNTGSKERATHFIAAKRKVLVVEAVDEAGCAYRLEKVVEADTCTSSILELNQGSLFMYPNPASGGFFVRSTSKPLQITVYNVLGVQVGQWKDCSQLQYLSLKEAGKGAFLVKVEFSGYSVSRRMLLQ